MIGRILKDQYLIKEFVAEGGMAMVYRAYCKKTDRDVAIKILKPEYYNDVNYVKSFRKEVQALFKLHHRNIVSVIDVGTQDGLMYMVMDFVEGETLKQRIEEQGCISVEECVHIGKRICMALQHAHLRGLIHRDLKPQNIIMTLDGEPMLMDFGIVHDSFRAEEPAQNNIAMGSVKYISPEQAKNAKIDKRSDIYSLGVMLYEMATGRVPFQGEDDMTIALKHIHQKPESPRELNAKIPESLNRIILKAMSKDPARRYKSAYEMFQDLSECFTQPDGEYIDYQSEEEEPQKENEGQKRRYLGIIAIFAAVLAIVAAAVLVFSQIFSGQEQKAGEAVVPSAIGMTESNAISMLEEANFKVQVTYEQGETEDEGLVVRQTPSGGEAATTGDTIQIIVCTKGSPVTMPNLVGTPIDQASQILRQLGLNNISLKYEPGEGNINEVIEQSPKAGEEVQTVQTIELTLLEASAESVGNINVPALVNLPLGEAVSRAASEGFVRILIYEEASEENEAGMVIAQVPNESVSETPGGDLTLWAVQQGEPNFFAQYTSEIQEIENGNTIRITTDYQDSENAELVLYESRVEDVSLFNQTLEEGITLSFYQESEEEETLSKQVNLYINNQLIRTDQILFTKE